jgi:hypothetical protein
MPNDLLEGTIMYIAFVVIAVLLAVALLGSAAGKLTKQPKVVETIGGLGVPLSWFPRLALAEIAGAVGLIIGLWIPALGIAAGVGIVLYFVGAVIAHVRAHDSGLAAPVVLGALAAAVVVLRSLTL